MRILKFLGITVGTVFLVFFIVFGFNLDAVYTLYENSGDLQEGQEWVDKTASLKGLTEFIPAHPDRVSLVSASIENPDTTIAFSAEQPHTMGVLSNFFLITTYARLVEEQQINPDKQVSLSDINKYQLPYIDASNHTNAIEALKSRNALNNDQVSLQNLVQAAVEFNDLAISDFLYYELGAEAIAETYQLLSVEQTDLPLPFSGLYIALHPGLHNSEFAERFDSLRSLPQNSFRELVLKSTDRFRDDENFHRHTVSLFEEEQGLGIGFSDRRDILSLFPQSTAEEMSRLMVSLQKDELISPEVSSSVRDIMSWPMQRRNISNELDHYGAIYDNRLGVVSGIDFGASTFTEEPFGQALFFDSLQVAFWFHMSSNLIHQDYLQRLMWDPALRESTLWEINNFKRKNESL